jgi:hypothetical protein
MKININKINYMEPKPIYKKKLMWELGSNAL